MRVSLKMEIQIIPSNHTIYFDCCLCSRSI